MEQRPSANLDLLRSVAVLLVLAQHILRRIHIDQVAWIATTSLGLFGVLLFFVHTSLVLMYSMQRSQLTGPHLLKNFYVRRIFRIYPLSILTVLAALALHVVSDVNGMPGLSHSSFPGMRVAVSNLFLIQNLVSAKSVVNVLWSLPFELQMYVFLPFIFLWVCTNRRLWQLLALWAVSATVAAWLPHSSRFDSVSLLRFLPNFLPGVIAFAMPVAPRIRAWLWPGLIAGIVGVYTLHPGEVTGWLLCLLLGVSIPLFAQITNLSTRWLSNRIATYSYGIYLSHQFSIWIALGLLGAYPAWLKGLALVGLLAALPVALYHGIEKPLIDAGVRLAKRWLGSASSAARPLRPAPAVPEPLASAGD